MEILVEFNLAGQVTAAEPLPLPWCCGLAGILNHGGVSIPTRHICSRIFQQRSRMPGLRALQAKPLTFQ
jgi:hypothetical protein